LELFRRPDSDETILGCDETIFRLPRRTLETADSYQADNDNGGTCRNFLPGDSQMRTLGFILACAFVLAGSTMAGTAEGGLPSVGTFAYGGSPVAASQAMIVATRSGATE
jgi:hypothetical protein